MNKRIKELREYWKLNQEDFGKILGITKSGVSDIEAGRRKVTERHIIMLKNHNVNENWLRTGKGEKINIETAPELKALANKYNLSNEAQLLIEKFINLKPEHQEVVIQFIIQAADSLKRNDTKPENKKNLEELSDEEQIKLYRQELKHEREVKEKSEALRKSG